MRTTLSHALTPGAPHVRDRADLRWVMRTVLLALVPCVAVGLYQTGLQENRALLASGLEAPAGWRATLLARFGVGGETTSIRDCWLLGALHFVPLLAIALGVGAAWERIFAAARRRPRTAGLGVTAVLFTASLPPGVAGWQAALGISCAIVLGKEIFGGTGRNVFNPAVVGLVMLSFAYPDLRGIGVGLADPQAPWLEAFLGREPGAEARAMGQTSALACLLGAPILVQRRVASWRIMLGVVLGAAATGVVLSGAAWSTHLASGGLAFGAVFLATDPVTSASTDRGRWIHGLLIGFLVVLLRVANPVQPDGVLLAILLGNIAAPSIDHAVVWLHARKRRRRLGTV